jgi:hypothetical protein
LDTAFDASEIMKSKKEEDESKTWAEVYLNATDMADLEKMSKGMAFLALKDGKKGERSLLNKQPVVPKHVKDDPNFRFGKAAYLPGN